MKTRAFIAVLAVSAVFTAAGGAVVQRSTVARPLPASPASGKHVLQLPAFGWRAVGGADHYEFQIASDPAFNSSVLGHGHDAFETRNTWATIDEAVPNGTFWWHVRAVTKDGDVSAWSAPRAVRKEWSLKPRLLSPGGGADIRFPTTPLVLRWSPVPYAASYVVYLASDGDLGTLVTRKPVETEGLSFSPSITLADGHRYYWAVVPVDSGGNQGARSQVGSFTWRWPSQTTPRVTDLVSAPEQYDPQFSWTPVPGAARYEIEINPSHDWATGSKICCKDPVVTTTLSPTQLLANNAYYWRVRAINVDDHAGQWNEGPSFTKVFDNVGASGLTAPSVKHLHVQDNYGTVGGPGFATPSPVVVWDPVPGASGYQVDVAPYGTDTRPGDCDWANTTRRSDRWQVDTAVPAWTALAPNRNRNLPYPARNIDPTVDSLKSFHSGQAYCVRVRARTDDDDAHKDVFGDYTYLTNAFVFTGYATGSGSPNASAGDYSGPVGGAVQRQTPFFTWHTIPGAASYWVLVAKDASFTNVVDYALTNIPAYAPRRGSRPITYPDEETLYYWAVLPASRPDGQGAPGDPLSQGPASFKKLSAPPGLLQPSGDDQVIVGPPTFRWAPALGAKYYRLQVSQDPNFGDTLDDITTDSTAYTSTGTYAADAALYVRVRAEDENKVGLTWSRSRRFRNTLQTPTVDGANPRTGELIPMWTWKQVRGAVSYDIHVDLPDGHHRDFTDNLLTVFTATEMRGTGVFRWQVRAEFPEGRGHGTTAGPYSRSLTFTRTISPPKGTRAVVGARSVLLSWVPKTGAKEYRIEISSTPSFARTVESTTTEGTSFAPTLDRRELEEGGLFYWRVAAVDASRNSGNSSPVQTFRLPVSKKKH